MLTTEWGPARYPSCRDKGRMRGRVGAWCLSWWLFDSLGFREARWSHPNEDKHQAPSSTPPHPLSLQDTGHTFPDSIVKHHQDPGTQASQWIGLPDSVVKIH